LLLCSSVFFLVLLLLSPPIPLFRQNLRLGIIEASLSERVIGLNQAGCLLIGPRCEGVATATTAAWVEEMWGVAPSGQREVHYHGWVEEWSLLLIWLL
jgi:hypothetical protein